MQGSLIRLLFAVDAVRVAFDTCQHIHLTVCQNLHLTPAHERLRLFDIVGLRSTDLDLGSAPVKTGRTASARTTRHTVSVPAEDWMRRFVNYTKVYVEFGELCCEE